MKMRWFPLREYVSISNKINYSWELIHSLKLTLWDSEWVQMAIYNCYTFPKFSIKHFSAYQIMCTHFKNFFQLCDSFLPFLVAFTFPHRKLKLFDLSLSKFLKYAVIRKWNNIWHGLKWYVIWLEIKVPRLCSFKANEKNQFMSEEKKILELL